jgi:septal ring factor EnvC (AmiA/AmiB activator)
MRSQYKILNDSVKKLDEDLRAVKSNLVDIKTEEKKLNSQIEELSLENDMTLQDLNRITKKKE